MGVKRLTVSLFALFVLMAGIAAWLVFRMLLPIKPVIPYFPDEDSRIPVVKWMIGKFQPAYLYTYSKGDADYIRVVYRNAKNRIKLLDVMVGNRGQNKLELVGVSVAKDNYKKVEKVSDYGKYFRFGERIGIEYLRNVIARPGTGSEDALPPDREQARQLCDKLKTVCYSKDLVFLAPEEYWNFQLTGDFPNGTVVSAIGLSKLSDNKK